MLGLVEIDLVAGVLRPVPSTRWWRSKQEMPTGMTENKSRIHVVNDPSGDMSPRKRAHGSDLFSLSVRACAAHYSAKIPASCAREMDF